MAYGSLIEEPGNEILAATEKILVADVKTPFPVEFARTSSKRAGAPTLIPYKGGERVPARIFVLRPQLSEQEAKDMLWRRETHTENATKTYKLRKRPERMTWSWRHCIVSAACTPFSTRALELISSH